MKYMYKCPKIAINVSKCVKILKKSSINGPKNVHKSAKITKNGPKNHGKCSKLLPLAYKCPNDAFKIHGLKIGPMEIALKLAPVCL